MNVFYDELAEWWPLLSPVAEYADEAREVRRLLAERRPAARRVLELGCGGGHLAHHLREGWEYTLSDLSPAMLALATRLNPGCPHVVGDLRTLRLAERFDLVLVHDAVDYMLTEADLRAAFATAFHHLAPGGLAMFMPDVLAETFAPGTDVSGGDAPDGRGARLFEWVQDVGADGTVVVHYAFLLRAADGTVRTAYERHVTGLFPRATWERLLAEAGFRVEAVLESTDEDREPRLFFFGHKPGAG